MVSFTEFQASEIMVNWSKVEKKRAFLSDCEKPTRAPENKLKSIDNNWQEIADKINEDHKNYKAICLTGFLDS